MAENDNLKLYIDECNAKLSPSLPILYEVSFFKIYVKFEVYLSSVFKNYCIGEENSKGYCPDRKLAFTDEEHLNAVLKGDKQYIDYLKKIESLSKHIFVDNPFNVIFDVAENSDIMNKMIVLRNYIAHESPESKTKYIRTCLGGGVYIEPCDYLTKKNRRTSKSNYTIFIDKINEISDLVLDPPLV